MWIQFGSEWFGPDPVICIKNWLTIGLLAKFGLFLVWGKHLAKSNRDQVYLALPFSGSPGNSLSCLDGKSLDDFDTKVQKKYTTFDVTSESSSSRPTSEPHTTATDTDPEDVIRWWWWSKARSEDESRARHNKFDASRSRLASQS